MDKIIISNGTSVRPDWTNRIAVSYDFINGIAMSMSAAVSAGGSLIANTEYFYKVVAIMKQLIVISGDATSQITAIALETFDAAKYYWRIWDVSGEIYFEIAEDIAFSNIVATGHRTGDGVIDLTDKQHSGVVGTVTVAYVNDDSSGNTLEITSNQNIISAEDSATTDGTDMTITLTYSKPFGILEAFKIYRGTATEQYDAFFYNDVANFTDDGTADLQADEFWFKEDIIGVDGIFIAPSNCNGVTNPGRTLLALKAPNRKNNTEIDLMQVSNHPTWSVITQTANSIAENEFNGWL